MATIHNLGFPRMGAKRELKFALESYWRGQSDLAQLEATGAALRRQHWAWQAGLDWAPVGDFSFYDHVLDMSFTLGNVPERARRHAGSALEQLFRVARGRARDADADAGAHEGHAACGHAHGAQKGAQEGEVAAGEMTKWFDTNYHYIVPELHADTAFSLDASRLLAQLAEAKEQGVKARPVIIGPVTYLALGKTHDGSDRLALLPRLLPVYAQLLERLHEAGAEWVQVDEPLLVTDLDEAWRHAFNTAAATSRAAARSCCWPPTLARWATTATWPPTCPWRACTWTPWRAAKACSRCWACCPRTACSRWASSMAATCGKAT